MDIEEYKRNVISADILADIAGSPDARTIPGMLHQILLEQRRMADAMSQMARIEAAREADRDFAASCDRVTLLNTTNLPTGLTEMQKDAVRTAVEYSSEGDFDPLMSAFPEVFADELVTTKWVSGKRTDELIRVANMDGARVVATRDGITCAGLVSFDDGGGNQPFLRIAGDKYYHGDKVLLNLNGWIVTVTAPKPVDRVISDPVVMACTKGDPHKRVLFRAEDGNWSPLRGSAEGVWMTKKLVDVELLSAPIIAGLMGGAK